MAKLYTVGAFATLRRRRDTPSVAAYYDTHPEHWPEGVVVEGQDGTLQASPAHQPTNAMKQHAPNALKFPFPLSPFGQSYGAHPAASISLSHTRAHTVFVGTGDARLCAVKISHASASWLCRVCPRSALCLLRSSSVEGHEAVVRACQGESA